MRIAIATDWFAPRRGGIEAQLRDVATRLAVAGNDVGVMTATPGPGAEKPFAVRRLAVATLPSPPLAISPALCGVLRRELERGWDVVHAHVSVVSPVGWAAAFVARSMGLPTVVTFHSMLRGKAILLRALRAATPLAGARVAWSAVSTTVADQVRWALGDDVAVEVLPNGVDLDFWRRPAPAAVRHESGVLTLIAAMRLHRKKRGRALVRAFALAARGVRARLLVVGEGPERPAIERDIESLGLRDGSSCAELAGWRSPEELRAIFASADAFVLPSVHEAFGIAALEAQAAGLPVIARRSGVTEFLVHGANGLLAESDEALVQMMRDFLRDAALRHSLRPDAEALRRFDWRQVVAAHLAEYERATRLAMLPARAGAASA